MQWVVDAATAARMSQGVGALGALTDRAANALRAIRTVLVAVALVARRRAASWNVAVFMRQTQAWCDCEPRDFGARGSDGIIN